ncbi:hypothetical protein LSM04_004886 [Trypanosoma melophagium]|uniref:uncharacterized protein n=1 Tax=Trypanosoma melophagium TaxID=715481 RepID=UPI00351AA4F2|nr:hypothetical protein LSM04_004886 [Trypanosoma melophagium]
MAAGDVGGSGGVFNATPEEFVKATADVTSRLRDAVDVAKKDPSKEIGITAEELQQRRKLATSPRNFVGDGTNRLFEVKSSARAQQIMNKGLLDKQREMRQKEVLKKMGILRKVQVGMFIVGIGFVWWMGVEFLLPQYAAVQERNRILQIRYERAQMKLEEYEKQKTSGD